jgi:glycosyltransferase involved in cell wall biosynthesis
LKKKVLFVNGHLNIGGVEKSLIDVLKSFNYDLYEVDLILFEGLGDYANEVPTAVNIVYYDLSKTYGPIKQCILENLIKRNWFALCLRLIFFLEKLIGVKALSLAKPLFKLSKKYDCAIAYRVGFCTDFVGYIVNSKNKVTWWHHGTYDYPDKYGKHLIKVFNNFNKIIAVSNSCKEMLINNIEGISKKITTIPNMININEIIWKASQETSKEFKNNENITLLSVGRLSSEKGMINCVHACRKLIDSGFNIKWYLIGDGIEREKIERCIKENQMGNFIYLLGAKSNPYPYIKGAYIYVHPSLVESLSITVLEAFALKTPVIVARSMGPAEFIRNKTNGLLVDPSPEGLFKGIVSLLKDDTLYNQLKKDKFDVLKDYSPEVIMKKVYDLIEAKLA